MVEGTWGCFESERIIEGALITDQDILNVTLLPSEHGSFASGGRLRALVHADGAESREQDFHIKVFSPTAFKTKDAMTAMRDEEAHALITLDGSDGVSPRLHLLGTFTDIEGTRYPALVMDRVTGLTLYRAQRAGLISGQPEVLPDCSQAAAAGLLIARAIKSCSDRGFTHRDLWPANILVKPGETGIEQVHFIDFGSSTETIRNTVTAISSDLRLARQNYGAPEVFGIDLPQRQSRNAASVDVWSLGALLFFLRTGSEPMGVDPATGAVVDPAAIDHLDGAKLRYLAQIKATPLDLMEHLEYHALPTSEKDANLGWLIAQCTQIAPADRPSIDEVVHNLETLLSDAPLPAPPALERTVARKRTTPQMTATPLIEGTPTFTEKTGSQARSPKRLIVPVAVGALLVAALAGGSGLYLSLHDLGNARIHGVGETYAYSPKGADRPEAITVTNMLGQLLEEGTDYELEIADADQVGTATVRAIGHGAYKGSTQTAYEVAAADLSSATVALSPTSAQETGAAIEPTVTVRLDGTKLAAKTDYAVSYKDNVKAGKAKVLVTGTGNYTGEASASFTITERPAPAPVYRSSKSSSKARTSTKKTTAKKTATKKSSSQPKSDVNISKL